MKTAVRAIAALFLVVSATAFQANPEDAKQTLPRFEDFPISVTAILKGTPADPQFQTPGQRMFRTMIRLAAKKGPSFAGHYTVAEWGCGTACIQIAIVDTQSGHVYDGPFGSLPKGGLYLGSGAFDDEYDTGIFYRLDSHLFVLRGCPNYKKCGSYYYKWNGTRFTLLRQVPMRPLFGSDDHQFPPIADAECAPDGNVKIVYGDGTEFQASKEPGQISCGSPAVAENKFVAGWLVEQITCCQPYPIPTLLVVYSPNRLRYFGGEALIGDWRFLEGGTHVAFCSNSPHGDNTPHYELRDVETGRLIGKWDGHLTEKAPAWTKGMRQ
jgi:hypothetical protein